MLKTIQSEWLNEILVELESTKKLKIISPFITLNVVKKVLNKFKGKEIELITRYNLNDFKVGASSLDALQVLQNEGCKIKGIKNLHSKMYLFDERSVIITSANFTSGGFFNNREFGILSKDKIILDDSLSYFNKLWSFDDQILSEGKISDWRQELNEETSEKKPKNFLPDYGISEKDKVLNNRKYFIKFFGKNNSRVKKDYHARREIEHGCCHYALAFSRKKNDKRPRKYRDGDVVFMARMLDGKDYAIFGRGNTFAHQDTRDVADINDIKHAPWLKDWPILIRVHSTKFIDSKMEDCPRLREMIENLDYESFDKTLKKHSEGIQKINPWHSLRQQADVQLSESGAFWLERKFKNALSINGMIPESYIKQFYQGIKL